MTAPQTVRTLIAQYDRERGRSQAPPGSVVRHQAKYLRKLFQALAWDGGGASVSAALGGRVVPEHTLKLIASEGRLPPEYSLRLDGNRKCFVGITLDVARAHDDPSPALNLRRFAWSANIPGAILGNFEELALYNGRIMPRSEDRPDVACVLRFPYKEYEERWEEIAHVLSKSAVENGALERLTENAVAVDDAFLDEIEGWRRRLAQDLDARNRSLSLGDLNSIVQLVIDRIIFLRICEDRGIEPYGQLKSLKQGENVYRRLVEIFGRADARYNAGLFRGHAGVRLDANGVSVGLNVGDDVLRSIFRGLYYPESPYEFSVIGADILGQVYERFLGQVIVRSDAGGVSIEEKPEVRKSGGVYYTPSYVVDHLVRETVGRSCEGKTPDEVARLRILDPACGSGSFLNVAYQYLLDWHLGWYVSDGVENHRDRVRRLPWSGHHLTLAERKRILLNSIYGVDLDAQAVEVTKLSLLLKVLEGEEGDGVRRQQLVLVRDRALPSLDENIRCGNTLVGPDFGARAERSPPNERERLRPFDYEASFSKAFASESPGFDVVLGNPPYLSYSGRQSVLLPDAVREYYQRVFESYQWPAAHAFFIERSIKQLSRRYVAFIVPDQVGHLKNYGKLRTIVSKHGGLAEVRYWGENVFKGVTTPALTFVFDRDRKSSAAVSVIEEAGASMTGIFLEDAPWHVSRFQPILDKAGQCSFSIREWVRDCGIRTSNAKEQVISVSLAAPGDVPVLEGKVVQRYACSPPVNAVRMLDVGAAAKYAKATFLIRQTAAYPIVGPHEHAIYFRNSLLALDAIQQWPDVRYVVGLLNSRFMRFLYQESVREAKQGAFPQVKVGSIGALPLRMLDSAKPEERAIHDEIVESVDEILHLQRTYAVASDDKRELINRRIGLVDDRIDRLVDQLYDLSRPEVALTKLALGIEPTSVVSPERVAEDATSDELWQRLERGTYDEIWCAALAELAERKDPGLSSYVVVQLQANEISADRRNAMVFAAEKSQCFDPRTRTSLKNSLLTHAVLMRDAGEQQPLWAAIRRYASLVPLDEVGNLLLFLRDTDVPATKQVAFQAIQNIFGVDYADDRPAVEELRGRVHALAGVLIAPTCLGERGGPALALQAFCAGAALRVPGLPALAERLAALGRPYVRRRAQEHLQSLDELWARGSQNELAQQQSRRDLSEALARLVAPAHGAERERS